MTKRNTIPQKHKSGTDFALLSFRCQPNGRLAILSSDSRVCAAPRRDLLSQRDLEGLCAHIRGLFDAEAERLAALAQQAAA
jgi:hypothetical protein